MAKMPVKMRAVVYGLSPFQQKVMAGLWKDLPGKIHHKVADNWISTILLLAPLLGTYGYVQHYQEIEKLAHRVHLRNYIEVHFFFGQGVRDGGHYRLPNGKQSCLYGFYCTDVKYLVVRLY